MRGMVLWASLAVAQGCGARRDAARLEGSYTLGEPGEGWERVRPGGADQAWHNRALGATLYADSNCGERFDDAALPRLHDALLGGVAGEPLREESRTVDGREALLRVFDGSVDGVPIRVGALILKKDACTYDLVYIAPPDRFDAGLGGFEAMIAAFRAQGAE